VEAETLARREFERIEESLAGRIEEITDHLENARLWRSIRKRVRGTSYESRGEQKLTDENASHEQREAAAREGWEEALAAEKAMESSGEARPEDYASNVGRWEDLAGRTRGTSYEGRVEARLAGARKTKERFETNWREEEARRLLAAAEEENEKDAEDYARNLRRLEEIRSRVEGTRHEKRFAKLIAREEVKKEAAMARARAEREEADRRARLAEEIVEAAPEENYLAAQDAIGRSDGRGEAVLRLRAVMKYKDRRGFRHRRASPAAYRLGRFVEDDPFEKYQTEAERQAHYGAKNSYEYAIWYYRASFHLNSRERNDALYRIGELYLKLGHRTKAFRAFVFAAEKSPSPGARRSANSRARAMGL